MSALCGLLSPQDQLRMVYQCSVPHFTGGRPNFRMWVDGLYSSSASFWSYMLDDPNLPESEINDVASATKFIASAELELEKMRQIRGKVINAVPPDLQKGIYELPPYLLSTALTNVKFANDELKARVRKALKYKKTDAVQADGEEKELFDRFASLSATLEYLRARNRPQTSAEKNLLLDRFKNIKLVGDNYKDYANEICSIERELSDCGIKKDIVEVIGKLTDASQMPAHAEALIATLLSPSSSCKDDKDKIIDMMDTHFRNHAGREEQKTGKGAKPELTADTQVLRFNKWRGGFRGWRGRGRGGRGNYRGGSNNDRVSASFVSGLDTKRKTALQIKTLAIRTLKLPQLWKPSPKIRTLNPQMLKSVNTATEKGIRRMNAKISKTLKDGRSSLCL